MSSENKENKNSLWRYAGLTFQIMAGIGISLFIGLKIDEWLKFSKPFITWALPLFFIISIIVRIIIDTNKK